MKEAGELRENFEVYCDPHLFPWEVILTPLQKGKKLQELEREKEEARERKEEFEVHHNPRFFRRSMSLVLLQKEGRRKEFGREQTEKEVKGHKEKSEVSRDPRPYRHSTTLIPWQRGKRREELERGKKEGAEEAATKAKETLKEKVLKSVQTKSRPTTPGYSSGGGSDDKNAPPVAGPSGWVNVDELPHPSIFSPAETGRSPGRLDSDKATAGDRYHQGGQSRNPFSAFFVRLYFGG